MWREEGGRVDEGKRGRDCWKGEVKQEMNIFD
jgi:hypothetical protein